MASGERYNPTLSTPANRPSNVQKTGRGGACWQNEVFQRSQRAFMLVDPMFERRNMRLANYSQMMLIWVRTGQFRADRKKFALNPGKLQIDVRVNTCASNRTEMGVKFVNGSVGFDSVVVFGYSWSSEQSRAPRITGARVNFHALIKSVCVLRNVEFDSVTVAKSQVLVSLC